MANVVDRLAKMRAPRQLLAGWLLLLCCSPLLALDPGRSLNQFHHTAWTAKDGVPGQITALAQTKGGYLWLATQTGLFRFDGLRFERYEAPGTTPFPASSVASLFAPPSGGLWVGFRYGAASFVREKVVVHYGAEQGLPSGTVFGFAQDHDGVVWAATFQGLVSLRGQRWEEPGPESGYPGKQARTVFVDRDGTLWVASERALVFLPRGANRFIEVQAKVGRISQITQAPDGGIWVAESDGGVREIVAKDGSFSSAGGLSLPSAGMLFDREGGLWATSLGDGIRRVADPARLRNQHLDDGSHAVDAGGVGGRGD